MDNSRISFQLILSLICLSCCLATYKFNSDSCETMLPLEEGGKAENQAHNENHAHHRRNADPDDEEPEKIMKLKTQDRGSNPFRVEIGAFEFKRNRPVEVAIFGGEINGFMLQARGRDQEILGKFENIPKYAEGLECSGPDDTVIHKDTSVKENLTFTWRAPAEPPKSITFMLTAVQNDKMWTHVHSRSIPLSPFPPSLAGCGHNKSCYRQSRVDDCAADVCDYVITTEVTEENEVVVIIGGVVEENSGYIGIGFTMDNNSLDNMDINACVKFMNSTKPQQFYARNWSNDSVFTGNMLETMADHIDEDRIWCQFKRALKNIGDSSADLSQVLHQTILTGKLNETTELPILPSAVDVSFVTQEWNSSQTIKVMHLIGTNSMPRLESTIVAMFLSIFMVSFLSNI